MTNTTHGETYTACFANTEQDFVVKTYKSYGWARRFIDNNRWLYANYRNCPEWCIERIMPRDEWGQTCVLAQSKGYSHKTRFRNRSEADKWVKAEGVKSV